MISLAVGIIAGILAGTMYGYSIALAVVIGLAAFIACRLAPAVIAFGMFILLAIGTGIAYVVDFFLDKDPTKRKLKR